MTIAPMQRSPEPGDLTGHSPGAFIQCSDPATGEAWVLSFDGLASKPSGEALRLKPVRVGLVDVYGGSMPSGWIRWMLEQPFPTTFEVVYPPALDAGNPDLAELLAKKALGLSPLPSASQSSTQMRRSRRTQPSRTAMTR